MPRRLALTLCGLLATAAHAAGSGGLAGRVRDAESRAPIAGARVELVAAGASALSDADGRFELAAPPGPHPVRVLCPGYAARELTLEAGGAEILLRREAGATFDESIVVRSPAPGPDDGPRADNRVSGDAIARLPDSSAAEVLQRIPGAIVERDRGEADHVTIRGAESRLVSTALDGERLASPEGDVRSAGIGLIPADLLAEVRVSKTITPDMDGDAIGGVVDLVTRNAPAGGLRKADLSTAWDSEAEDRFGGGGFTLGRRFADDRLGALLSASTQEADRGADQLEARYDGADTDRVELRDYALTRTRLGLAAALDYAPGRTTQLRARGLFSSLATDELRRRAKFDLGGGEIERELKDAHLEREIASVTLGAEHLVGGGFQIDYKLGAQRAAQEEPGRIDTSFIQEEVDFAPVGLQPNPSNEDLARFRLDKIGVENNRALETSLFASVNFGSPLPAGEADSGLLRGGLKLRQKSKNQDTDTTLFETDDDLFLESFLDPRRLGTGFLRGRYDLGPVVDRGQARGLIERFGLGGSPSLEEEAADYEAAESTAAAYLMTEWSFGGRLGLTPGVRYEHTRSDYRGFEVFAAGEEGDSSVRALAGSQSYGVWLPGVHAVYSMSDDLRLRGAATRTLARPDYFDLVPYRIFDFEDAEVELGNPDLRPTTAWNLDLGLEWRPRASTEISLALFDKQMRDFIYTRRSSEPVADELFEVTRPTNGPRATLRGFEVSMRHRFGAESRFLEGFGVELHYTGTSSSAAIGEPGSERLRLPGQAAHSSKLLLSFERGRIFSSLSLGYVGDFLLELGEDRGEDIHRDSQLRADLAAGISLNRWARLYLHLNNLTDEPVREYQGSPDRLHLVEYTGWSARLGLTLGF